MLFICRMGSEMIIELPLKPFLKDYLVHLFGPEPIFASNTGILFPILYPMLEIPPKITHVLPAQYESSIKITLPYQCVRFPKNPSCYFYINDSNVRNFQKIIHWWFRQDFYHFMESRMSLKEKIQNMDNEILEDLGKNNFGIFQSINDFCTLRDINPDHVDFDALCKSYFRYRKSFFSKS